MGGRFNKSLRVGCALVLACVTATTVSVGRTAAFDRNTGSLGQYQPAEQGMPAEKPTYVAVGEATRSPIGWVEFCAEYKGECATQPSPPRDIVLSLKSWSDLIKVNNWVNENIQPITDLEHWGVVERWNYPDDGKGDCEDYVLLKRRMLMQAGWPREALLITVVRDKRGDGHAVLTVKTNKGEFILDNQESQILAWNKTGYRFVKRQSQNDPNVWVSLGEPRGPAMVSSR